jgi:hypothetical protein
MKDLAGLQCRSVNLVESTSTKTRPRHHIFAHPTDIINTYLRKILELLTAELVL